MTIRRNIITLLEDQPMNQREIADALGIRLREVIEHLGHVARTVAPRQRLVMEPVCCLSCNFVFQKRKRYKKPHRCPICRSENLTDPVFSIRQSG